MSGPAQSEPPEPPSPGAQAAVLARSAFEEAMFAIPGLSQNMDRAGIGARLRRAIQCAYTVIDSHVLSPPTTPASPRRRRWPARCAPCSPRPAIAASRLRSGRCSIVWTWRARR
ncbi:MAG: hypothetical protein WKG00_03695 [Polyangiaceae bacterium]